MNKLFVIMGVSGCGKSTVSSEMAKRTGWPVLEADDFHSPDNIAKMSKGVPLTDQDREPWVDIICSEVNQANSTTAIILACSALTEMVQSRLLDAVARPITWIWLDGCQELIKKRSAAREGHFMAQGLIKSQFDALSIPSGAIKIDIDQPIPKIVDAIEDRIAPI